MKLSELIAAVGDDNVTYQTIATDMHTASVTGNSARVTFTTSPKMVLDMMKKEPEFLGLVVWIPKALLPDTAVSQEAS